MQKKFKHGISLLLCVVICFASLLPVSAAGAANDDYEELTQWIEMGESLLSNGKDYVSGVDSFSSAIDDAKALLNGQGSGTAAEAVDGIKSAWVGLKYLKSVVIAPAPVGGYEYQMPNNTGFAGFGDKYCKGTVKSFAANYDLAPFGLTVGDVDSVSLYAYAYSSNTGENFPGTTLKIGSAQSGTVQVRLTTNADWSAAGGWKTRNAAQGTFTYNNISELTYTGVSNLSNNETVLVFRQKDATSSDNNWFVGSMTVNYGVSESLPVSYDSFRWIALAEALLQENKTYLEGKAAFDSALEELKACDSQTVEEKIAALKTAWAALKYATYVNIYPGGAVDNDTGATVFGDKYEVKNLASGGQAQFYYNVSAAGIKSFANIYSVYLYAYGYDNASGLTSDMIAGTTLPVGNKNASVNWVTLSNPSWQNVSGGSTYLSRASLNKFEFSGDDIRTKFTNGADNFIYQQASSSNACTIYAGTMTVVLKNSEKVPAVLNGKMAVWADRADRFISDANKTFTDGIDNFNVALEALKNGDEEDAEALIADLKAAWNDLEYDEVIEIGLPSAESTDVTATYGEISDPCLGSKYVVTSSSAKLQVRFDTLLEASAFDDFKAVYFYIKGHLNSDSTQKPNTNWTTYNLNNNYFVASGPNVSINMTKYSFDLATLKAAINNPEKNNGNVVRNILLIQGNNEAPSTWIVGSLFAVAHKKAHLNKTGDVNGDGNINVLDLIRLKKYLADSENVTLDAIAADADENGMVLAADLIEIKHILLTPAVFGNNPVSEDSVF